MSKKNIQIVEDEGIVVMHIEQNLKSLGYDVSGIASSGKKAIEIAEKTHPDLVLMDIVLKGEMDGIEAADQIRKRLDIPVIFLTAFGDENTLQRAKATEPFAYLLKPFKEKELHIAIEIALYKHETENKLKRMEQRLATILRSIGDAVIVSDTQGSITFMNSAAEALTGWKQADALGKKMTDVYNLKRTASSILIDRSDREIPLDGSRANIMDEKGAISGEVIVFRDITEKKQAENVLTFLAQAGAARGEDFFQSLAVYIAKNLNMDYVCIDRLEGDGLNARTVAIYSDGKFEDNMSYALKDTPCGDVVGKKVCCFPSDVRNLFPKDAVLQEMIAESYVGVTLWSHAGEPIGLIAVIGRRPLSNPRMAESLLKLVAIRASGELERKQAEEELRKLNAELDQRVKERTVELEKRNTDLETTLKAFVGRELRMVELKEMVANLEKKINLIKKD